MEHRNYIRLNKNFFYALCSVLLLTIATCTWGMDERHAPAAGACPYAFWVPDQIAAEFRNYPEGHPMREFFKMYVSQQRQLDAYHGYPSRFGVK